MTTPTDDLRPDGATRRRPAAARASRPTRRPAGTSVWRPTEVAATARWLLAFGAALVIFAAFLLAKGANPHRRLPGHVGVDRRRAPTRFGELLVQSTPFLLAGLAVAVPARAGLFNIGGEGQLLLGGIGAVWAANLLGHSQRRRRPRSLVMALGGAIFGGAVGARSRRC